MAKHNANSIKRTLAKKEKEIEKMHKDFKQLSQVKDELISVVSHELRTPLTIIKEGINLTLDEVAGKINSKQKQFLSVSRQNIDRLSNLINDLLDISKIEAKKVVLRKSLVDLGPFIRNTVSPLESVAVNKKISIKYKIPDKEMSCFMDPDKITQVVNNLVSNALKFTKPNGSITVIAQENPNNFQISVCDTGVGISKQNMEKLFNKFVQVSRTPGPGEKGTGLGLAICKGLVELHGGRTWVESALGKGSKFHFIIPRVSYEEIFREYVKNNIRESQDKEKPFSIMVSRIDNFADLKKKYGMVKPYLLLGDMVDVIKGNLRRVTDVAIRDSGECAVVLSETNKHGVVSVEQRTREALAKLLVSKQMDKEVQVSFGNSTYPEDALEHIEMIARARASFEGLYFGSERRKARRVYTKLHIELAPPKSRRKKDKAQSINISRGGLCVFSNVNLPIGTNIDIDIKLPQSPNSINAAAKVVWVKKITNITGFKYKVGLKYENIDRDKLNEVMSFVSGMV